MGEFLDFRFSFVNSKGCAEEQSSGDSWVRVRGLDAEIFFIGKGSDTMLIVGFYYDFFPSFCGGVAFSMTPTVGLLWLVSC
jgi:hypothetical protein